MITNAGRPSYPGSCGGAFFGLQEAQRDTQTSVADLVCQARSQLQNYIDVELS
jgi:hypothetical protein